MKKTADFPTLHDEILALHRAGIEAHLQQDVSFFTQNISDNYLSVSRGEIHRPTKEQINAQFENYLHNTTFETYEDVQEPIIGFSQDGSMAWSIAQVWVVGDRKMPNGQMAQIKFICAWMMLYERRAGEWVRLADVSTFPQ